MKKLLCILFLGLIFLTACSRKIEYKNDLACEPLVASLAELCETDDGYSQYNDEQIKFLFDNAKVHDDYAIFYSNDANDINEIGIFHCPDQESAEKMLEITREYLTTMQQTQVNFISSYAPYEIPKLEAAKAERYGNYVVYTILDTNAERSVYAALENKLEK